MHNAITLNSLSKQRSIMSAFKHSVETDTGFIIEYAKQGKVWRTSVYHSGYVVRELNVSCIEEARALFDLWLDEFNNLESEGK